jgi:hypothetical protein
VRRGKREICRGCLIRSMRTTCADADVVSFAASRMREFPRAVVECLSLLYGRTDMAVWHIGVRCAGGGYLLLGCPPSATVEHGWVIVVEFVVTKAYSARLRF